MIVVKLRGGLGNQMFQYALGRYLSIKNQSKLRFDIGELGEDSIHATRRDYMLHVFNVSGKIAKKRLLVYINNINMNRVGRLVHLHFKHIVERDLYFSPKLLSKCK